MRPALSLGAISWACALQPGVRPAARVPAARLIQGIRLFAGIETDSDGAAVTPEALRQKARDFLAYKNAAGRGENTLDPVFDMCSPEADIYGLRGESIRPGLTAFFQEHEGLHHEPLSDPETVGPSTVQYPFVKTWRTSGEDGCEELQRWSSVDPEKPRNKVERLQFDAEGRLARVSVVEVDTALEPLDRPTDE